MIQLLHTIAFYWNHKSIMTLEINCIVHFIYLIAREQLNIPDYIRTRRDVATNDFVIYVSILTLLTIIIMDCKTK